jgi:surfactin synthase thioesterase subunit
MSVNLFCLPYAGGSKYSLFFLKKVLPKNIECHFLEYSGRGTRMHEPFANNINEIVEDLFLKIAPLLDKPYSIFGHSMGATLTYLLALRIRKAGKPDPLHLFLSGTDAPSVRSNKPLRYLLPKNELIDVVKELGGLPDEILAHEEMLEFFEPILRADFRVLEMYKYEPSLPLQVPFTVMVGNKEDMEEKDILKWQTESSVPLKLFKFSGNHFFILTHQKEIGKVIESRLFRQYH